MQSLRCTLFFLIFLAFSAGAQQSTRVRILALMDTQAPGIGESIEADASRIASWYKSVFESDQLPGLKGRADLHFLGIGQKISPALVQWYFRNHPIMPGEALMVVYSGHGAFNQSQVLGGQYLDMSGGAYNGWDLSSEMFKQQANLNILIVDACSTLKPLPINRHFQVDIQVIQGPNPAEQYYKDLFFNSRGFFVANAAHPGRPALGLPGEGGYFLQSFFDALDPVYLAGVAGQNVQGNWKSVFVDAQALTVNRSRDLLEELKSQVPADHPSVLQIAEAVPQVPKLVNNALIRFNALGEIDRFEWRADFPRQAIEFASLFKVYGFKGHKVQLQLFFYDMNGKPLKWKNGGYVSVGKSVSQLYDSGIFGQSLLVPMETIALLPREFQVRLQISHGNQVLAVSKAEAIVRN